MDIYADALTETLRSLQACNNLQVNEYIPKIPSWASRTPETLNLRMRLSRYLAYPLQARAHQGTVNHIIDHGYAHLLHIIDPKRSVVTVHDLIPLLAWKGVIPGLSYSHYPFLNKVSLNALRKARAIIAVSNSTKNDLINYCKLPEEKISVIHNGLDNCFRSEPAGRRRALRKTFGFPDESTHLILITGSLSYKNHSTSLRVVEQLQAICQNSVQLVRLGADNHLLQSDLKGIRLNKPLLNLQSIDKQRLVDLYNSVDCLLFPSLYEGFGWPPLEAMACGTPVVTSDAGSLPEIVGNAALMASPNDVGGLCEAILTMLEDSAKRREFVRRGLENAARFSWERCASAIMDIYQKI